MPATIQPALRDKLEARALGPFDVVIEFAQLPSADEMQALGLELDGASARGRLSREQILAIASFPQVKSIGLTDQPIAPRRSEPSDAKLRLSLRMAMEEQGRHEFNVIVTFHAPPQRLGDIEGLTIHHAVGFGRLSREAILRLATSDEVVTIDLEPKDMLMPSELPPDSGGGHG